MLHAYEALNDALSYYDPSWGYYHMLTPSLRAHLDEKLVALKHPIAEQPGTNWARFNALRAAKFRFAS